MVLIAGIYESKNFAMRFLHTSSIQIQTNDKEDYPGRVERLNTITSAPRRIVLVLKPLPSKIDPRFS